MFGGPPPPPSKTELMEAEQRTASDIKWTFTAARESPGGPCAFIHDLYQKRRVFERRLPPHVGLGLGLGPWAMGHNQSKFLEYIKILRAEHFKWM
ncbi:hypothetical protein K504DRAFT_500835 [Pleomassaria siparia CBS 279.74]|uniref:Uncharacterized protein n=1 Tax=Pleomassaria siparia CBS 279.74 TaxID=1314801 RepID=A0A6G1KDJ3_9PLEO|nr:hypothetical protein K504DRAFT_500835 [Pleomassaria siparia CBS 279.74]